MNTNLVTVRQFGKEQVIEVNGHEIPFVVSIADEPNSAGDPRVTLVFDAAQYNEVTHGEDIPVRTSNTRADKYLTVIHRIWTLVENVRWWNAVSTLRTVRSLIREMK